MAHSLNDLKADIADDIDDEDGRYAAQIASAISASIELYAVERFYFNETRTITFSTVVAQQWYGTAANANIPTLFKIDAAFCSDAAGEIFEMSPVDPAELEVLSGNSAATGQPSCYAYFASQLRLYPIPDAATYTIRLQAQYLLAEPSSGSDSTTAWTNAAYQLIRNEAKIGLGLAALRDTDLVARSTTQRDKWLRRLRRETTMKTGTGRIVPMWF